MMSKARTYRTGEQRPGRVGLYLGDYSFLCGLWQYWGPVLDALHVHWTPLWDRSFLSDDILQSIKTLIVPGGFCWSHSGAFGGRTGRRNLRRAVTNGLNYVGTCYGANVAMSGGTEKRICHFGLVRGRTLSHRTFACQGTVCIDYDAGPLEHTSLCQETAHVNGRLFGEGDYEVLGRFSADQPGPFDTKPAKPIGGLPASIMAKHGAGNVVLFSSHPEMPISYQYPSIHAQISVGDMSVDEAVRRCWNPPAVTKANMKLLQSMFRWLRRAETVPRGRELPQPSAERAGLFSSAKGLQKLYLAEIEQSLLARLRNAKTPTLQFATRVLERRLRQARYFLNRLTADNLWSNPQELERASLILMLRQFGQSGDHPGYIKKMRFDFQVAQAKRIASLRGANRERLEHELAGLVVAKLDTLVQLGQRPPTA